MTSFESNAGDCREIRKIDLDDFRQSGAGANGCSYDSLTDSDQMVKLYNCDYPVSTIHEELEIAEKVFRLGIPSPKPGEFVTDGERFGILFRRIRSKRSFSRMLSDEPERVEEFTREFAGWCKKMHDTECPEGLFPDAKEQFLDLLDKNPWITGNCRSRMGDFIRNVPETGTCLHGDMHFGNVLSTLPAGAPLSVKHDCYFIDLGYFSRGCPLFDIGMTQCICLYCDEEFRKKEFHITGDLAARAWNIFIDEYFFGEDHLADRYFGPGKTPEDVSREIIPYMCCKFLLVGYNVGSMPPNYMNIILDTFGRD